VSTQLARNSGLRVRINRKVPTTAADSDKQGYVQAMDFGIPGYDNLVWVVSFVSDRIGSSTQHGLNGKLQLGDYFNARARIKNNRYKCDYAAKNIAFALAILSVAGKIHPEFFASPVGVGRHADGQVPQSRWGHDDDDCFYYFQK